jgi:hypothetical protein
MHGHVTLCYIVVGGNLNSPLNLFISFANALMEQGFRSDLFWRRTGSDRAALKPDQVSRWALSARWRNRFICNDQACRGQCVAGEGSRVECACYDLKGGCPADKVCSKLRRAGVTPREAELQ